MFNTKVKKIFNIAPVDGRCGIDGADGTVESAISMDIMVIKAALQSLSDNQTRLWRACNIGCVVIVEGDVDVGGKKGNRGKSDFS